MTTPRLGVLGGTFDPVHVGHLAVGRAAAAALALTEIRLVPSRQPPHRAGARASGYHRFAMAALAVAEAGWSVSDVELVREGPSYTYDTLTAFAADGRTPLQICFLIGADAFAEIATWSRYPAILDLAHFVVVTRPGVSLSDLDARLPDLRSRLTTAETLAARTSPGIVRLEVATPDVSSTAVRAEAARSAALTGLVPEAVASYIRRQGLYGPDW